jgi:hypothetical protein
MHKRGTSRLKIKVKKYSQHGVVYDAWLVYGYDPGGRRVRKQFKTRQEAEAWASTEEIRYHNQNRDVHPVLTRLTHEQLLDAEMAFSRLNGRGSIADAVALFLRSGVPEVQRLTISEAVALFLAYKGKSGVRKRTLVQIRSVLKLFVARVGPDRLVHEITTADCEAFLAARGEAAKTYNNYRADLHSFFVHASAPKNGWHTVNPTTAIEKRKEDGRGMPAILPLGTSRKLMEYAESYQKGVMVPYFALALFAGIRTGTNGELWKLFHSEPKDIASWIDLGNGVIHIQPHISKTREYRQIKVQPNLAAWLTRYPVGDWPKNFDRHVKHIRRNFELGHDVLRHTFISEHVAAFGSIERAALQAGNTEAVTRKHYLNLTDSANAAGFWAIAPSKTKKQPHAQAGDDAINHEAA